MWRRGSFVSLVTYAQEEPLSLRQKYLTILSRLAPAGAVGISLALGAAAPAAANTQPSAAVKERVSDRLAAVRDAVSEVAGAKVELGKAERVAWWFRNGGFGWGFPNFRNWGNGWHNWGNWFHNW